MGGIAPGGSMLAETVRNPVLLRLETAWAAFSGAEWAVWVCLLVYAYDAMGATGSGLMALVQLVPCALLAPFVGALADRRRAGRVLFAGFLLQGAAMALVAGAIWLDAPVWAVFALAPFVNLGITVPRPARAALLPGLVHSPMELTTSNFVSAWLDNGCVLVAPAAAGVLIGIGGPQLGIAVLSVLAFAAAALVLPLPGAPPLESGHARLSVPAAALAGAREIWRDRPVRLLVGLLGAQYVLVGALDVLYAVLAISVFAIGEQGAGYLNAAFGAGGLIGAILAALLLAGRRLSPALVLGMLTAAVALGILGVAASLVAAFLLLGIVGLGCSIMDVTGRILLQRSAGPHMLAHVFSLLESLMNVGLAIGSLLVPLLIESSGVPVALGGVCVLFLGIALLTWRGLHAIDDAAVVPHVEIRLLHSIPLFARLPVPQLEGLARSLWPQTYGAGSVVMREGDEGDFYCAISEGEVEVTHAGTPVARLGRGEGFGEIALIKDVPRTATVVTTGETTVYCLSKEPFLIALTGHAPSTARATAVIAGRMNGLHAAEGAAGNDP